MVIESASAGRLYRWPRRRYEWLAELGVFEGQHVELIEGQIVEMSPKGPRHARLTNRGRKALERAFPADAYTVRSEQPLALGEWDAPEPDVAVVRGSDDDYGTVHPTAAQTVLVVEIGDTSADYDLGRKADLYAAAGLLDYWVVVVEQETVVVCRTPMRLSASKTTWRYAERRQYGRGATIAPLAADAAAVATNDLLP